MPYVRQRIPQAQRVPERSLPQLRLQVQLRRLA